MARDGRIWLMVLFLAVCIALTAYFTVRSLSEGPGVERSGLDCDGPMSDRPMGCFR